MIYDFCEAFENGGSDLIGTTMISEQALEGSRLRRDFTENPDEPVEIILTSGSIVLEVIMNEKVNLTGDQSSFELEGRTAAKVSIIENFEDRIWIQWDSEDQVLQEDDLFIIREKAFKGHGSGASNLEEHWNSYFDGAEYLWMK